MDSREKIETLREMVAETPNDALGWYMLGRELARVEEFTEAAEALGKAVALHPDHTASHREHGRALEKAGRLPEAAGAYRRGIEVAERTRDLQTQKEMRVFLQRVEARMRPAGESPSP